MGLWPPSGQPAYRPEGLETSRFCRNGKPRAWLRAPRPVGEADGFDGIVLGESSLNQRQRVRPAGSTRSESVCCGRRSVISPRPPGRRQGRICKRHRARGGCAGLRRERGARGFLEFGRPVVGVLRLDCGWSKDHGAGVHTALGGLRLDALDHLANQLGDFSPLADEPRSSFLLSHLPR